VDNELNPIETETAILVNNINQQASVELGRGLAEMRSAQHKILMIVPATALFTFFIAASFGWSIAHRFIDLRLDERLAERTHIARDLHDTMLQTFQGVLLKFYGLSVMLADRPDAQQKLEGLLGEARQAINEGREAVLGLRASTVIANDLARAFATLGEELAAKQDSTILCPFESRCKARRGICTRFLGTKCTALPARLCATPSSTAARRELRWASTMTTGSSGCASGTTGEVSTRWFWRQVRVRDTMVCRACTNAPDLRAEDWLSGVESIPARRPRSLFPQLGPTQNRVLSAGLHFCEEELDESVSP
jgi:Histidine kinase